MKEAGLVRDYPGVVNISDASVGKCGKGDLSLPESRSREGEVIQIKEPNRGNVPETATRSIDQLQVFMIRSHPNPTWCTPSRGYVGDISCQMKVL